jgi:hypothetical protein
MAQRKKPRAALNKRAASCLKSDRLKAQRRHPIFILISSTILLLPVGLGFALDTYMKQMVCAAVAAILWMVPQSSHGNLKAIESIVKRRPNVPSHQAIQDMLNSRRNPFELDANTNPPIEELNSLDLPSQNSTDSEVPK